MQKINPAPYYILSPRPKGRGILKRCWIKKKTSKAVKQDCYKNKSAKEIKQIVKFLKVISEENRLKILCLLEKKEKCVCEICRELDLPQNLVSHHLKCLKNFDLISSRKEGVKIFYNLNKKVSSKFFKKIAKFIK